MGTEVTKGALLASHEPADEEESIGTVMAVRDRGPTEPQMTKFEIWGQRGWHNEEVVGESHHASAIRALFPKGDLPDGIEVIVPVTLVHNPNNPHDRNAVEVRADTPGWLAS